MVERLAFLLDGIPEAERTARCRELSAAGGQKYLEQQAKANPVAFMTLVGKVLPLQVAGSESAPIQLNVIRYDVDTGVPR
jgi:hypothetical protein